MRREKKAVITFCKENNLWSNVAQKPAVQITCLCEWYNVYTGRNLYRVKNRINRTVSKADSFCSLTNVFVDLFVYKILIFNSILSGTMLLEQLYGVTGLTAY